MKGRCTKLFLGLVGSALTVWGVPHELLAQQPKGPSNELTSRVSTRPDDAIAIKAPAKSQSPPLKRPTTPWRASLPPDWAAGQPAEAGWNPPADRGPGCGAPIGNCQQFDSAGANLGSLTSDAVEGFGTGGCAGGGFVSADDVTLADGGTISSICFWGRYQAVTAVPGALSEVFDITLYSDAAGSPGPVRAGPFRVSLGACTLNRGPAIPPAFGPGFVWTANIPPVPVAPNECVWLSISGDAGPGGHNGGPNARFRWMVVNNPALAPNASGKVAQACHLGSPLPPFTFAPTDVFVGLDAAFCVNLPTAPTQCNPPFAVNAECAGAVPLQVNGPAITGNTAFGRLLPTPFCGDNPVNGNTLWYSIVAPTTMTIALDTCSANTNFDTVISVYCGGCDGLNCIANNDTSPAADCVGTGDPSTLSFVAEAGREYLVAVFGFELDAGVFEIIAYGAAGGNPLPCQPDRCTIPPPTGVVVTEADPCGASTNGDCAASGGSFNLGDTVAGNSYNLGAVRDFDFFELATPLATETWLDITAEVEFPGIFNFFGGACNQPADNGVFLGGAGLRYCSTNTIQLLVPAGAFRINILPVDFGGVPCGGSNAYWFRVTTSALGSCCVPATACFVSSESDCAAQGGAYQGDGTACTGDPCTPVTAGVCCMPTGACVPSISLSDCTLAGGGFVPDGACIPGACPAPAPGACCVGATCVLSPGELCIGTGAIFAGSGTTCNAPGNFSSPCCKGDFNHVGGITVQDIFDFLSAYFAASPLADINGGGISVQDIFDFLGAYFSGCTTTTFCDPFVCTSNGALFGGTVTHTPAQPRLNDMLQFCAAGVADTGGIKQCFNPPATLVVPPAAPTYTWTLTKPDGTTFAGAGACTQQIVANQCGRYSGAFTATVTRDCPPAPRVLPFSILVANFTLSSETEATTPANRGRTTVGVCERVVITTNPNINVNWTTTAGTVNPAAGVSTTWTAPDVAGKVTVTATLPTDPNCKQEIVFDVITPTGVTMVAASRRHTMGTASAGFRADCTIQPTTVSFYRCEFQEQEVAAVTTGSFNIWAGLNHPRGNWLGVGQDNTGIIDNVYSGELSAPYAAGTFLWAIPWRYRCVGDGGRGHQFAVLNHSATCTATGRMTMSKGGESTTRDPGDPTEP